VLQLHISAIRTGLWSIWSQVQTQKMNLNCISDILCKILKNATISKFLMLMRP
jgi:hypothetical protein